MAKKQSTTLDELARMVANGFKEARDERGEMRGELGTVREDVKILRTDMEGMEMRLNHRIDQLPTKTDLAIYATVLELKSLEQRVATLERKRGRAA